MNNHRVMVITGCSSGLGQCLYKSFSKSYKVLNISRSISGSEYNIVTNFNDLSDLNIKLKMNKDSKGITDSTTITKSGNSN